MILYLSQIHKYLVLSLGMIASPTHNYLGGEQIIAFLPVGTNRGKYKTQNEFD